ncbi:glycoside hydrolase family 5 protein [Purpureocillium lavendulum]|uniref:Glycoside hydrolase family 5 protein n=1 Tax=Purpureocillium lavendulum TaxID=1247861 RepID=A0AB34G4F7_9HYPO|nr:glycoside hydrolase family 5 protein [Purpureocillium lavendulum]
MSQVAKVPAPVVGARLGSHDRHRQSADADLRREDGSRGRDNTIHKTSDDDSDSDGDSLPLFSLPESDEATARGVSGLGVETPAWLKSRKRRPLRALLRSSRRAIRFRRSPCGMLLLILAAVLGTFVIYVWRRERSFDVPWIPDPASQRFALRPLPPPLNRTLIADYELPLRTKGRYVVDAAGRRFKLSSINWYGASDELFVAGGLDVRHRADIAQTIKKLGFNSVRLPYADETVRANPRIDADLVAANPDLAGLRAMDVFEAVVAALTDAGLAVIVNNHITSATWCCGADPCDAGWANDHLGPLCRVRQTEEEWIEYWEDVMARFVDNPLVIGADLRNEVRGLWGTMPWAKWATAAERCGNRLLAMKPEWLMVVEGTESANDVSGARTRPVRFDVPERLVYSAHVYKWSGWGSMDGRFQQRTYASFARAMRENWAYLLESDVAPVWVGELGAPGRPSVGDAHYWRHLWRFLRSVDADFGYWALNARKPAGNETEAYGLVADDWATPVLDYRLRDMLEHARAGGP